MVWVDSGIKRDRAISGLCRLRLSYMGLYGVEGIHCRNKGESNGKEHDK